MANTKITTGYTVEPRTDDDRRIYAVMREYTYRGEPGRQLVTIYTEHAAADRVRVVLNLHMNQER